MSVAPPPFVCLGALWSSLAVLRIRQYRTLPYEVPYEVLCRSSGFFQAPAKARRPFVVGSRHRSKYHHPSRKSMYH